MNLAQTQAWMDGFMRGFKHDLNSPRMALISHIALDFL
jgi:hypothetical protein